MKESSEQLIPKPLLKPFTITQALVGLALDDSDSTVLRYFNFFTQKIPTAAAYFMHVLPELNSTNTIFEKETQPMSSSYSVNEELVKKMEAEVENNFSQKEFLYVEYDIKEGNPLDAMLQTGEDLKIDLLVIGQSGSKSSHNILAKNLARKTSAHALVIPSSVPNKITNILVPIDFSNNAKRALEAAVSFHKQLESPAKITCLYVYSLPNLKHFKFDAAWIQTKELVESNIKDAFDAFVFSNTPEYQNQIELALVEKRQPGIAKYIMDHATDNQCDFMFLGAKGHSKVHLLLMGSVAEEILDINNNIPTIVVK